jgi:nicotinamidase-related amidase
LYGSEQWQIIPELAPQAEEVVVHKTTPDPFMNTSLHAHLQKNGIGKLIVASIQTAGWIQRAG